MGGATSGLSFSASCLAGRTGRVDGCSAGSGWLQPLLQTLASAAAEQLGSPRPERESIGCTALHQQARHERQLFWRWRHNEAAKDFSTENLVTLSAPSSTETFNIMIIGDSLLVNKSFNIKIKLSGFFTQNMYKSTYQICAELNRLLVLLYFFIHIVCLIPTNKVYFKWFILIWEFGMRCCSLRLCLSMFSGFSPRAQNTTYVFMTLKPHFISMTMFLIIQIRLCLHIFLWCD